ncbi:HET-domain-containing protein [Pyrenochaeta sp. DS3sAY3a]|nr:HET-domain-containing protein [Pyrenochaeta sp. DS3sAY3a]
MPEQRDYKYRELESPRHIRLLQASVNFQDITTYEIIHVCIDVAPDFEAVSYVWGSSVLDHRVALNEASVTYVTESLAEALPRLSRLSKTKRLWIDQICIDQSNISERNHQVRLMGWIYEQAECTLIWNGETNPVPEDMSQFLTEVADDVIQNTPFSEVKLRQQLQARFKNQLYDTRTKIIDFMIRPWFTRVWVYQEAILSKKPCFVIGDCLVPFDTMHYMVSFLEREAARTYQGSPYFRLGKMVSMRHERQIGFERPFYEVLMNGAVAAQSSNPRDLIYGFLGVLSNPHIEIEPNYALSFEEVAVGTATAIIKGLRSLDILAVVRHIGGTDAILPSWVPVWGSRYSVQAMYSTDPRQQSYARRRASQGRPHIWKTGTSKTDLIVQGRIIGHIDTVLPHFKNPFHSPWGSRKPVSRFLDLEALCQRLKGTAVCLDEQYLPRRLLAVCLADGVFSLRLQEELAQFPEVKDWGDIDALFAAYVKFQSSELVPELPPRTLHEAYYLVLEELSTVADRRCVFVCDDGKLGLSGWVRARDVVCILHGCTTPVILRPFGNGKYLFVDICYLENAMAGEAVDWDVDDATELVIV